MLFFSKSYAAAQNTINSFSNIFQDESRQGITIKEVSIEGNKLIPPEQILNVIKSRAGTAFDKNKILQDLEAIDNLGYFVRDSIQAFPERAEDGSIILKIRIQENSPIVGVQITGNKFLNTEELLQPSQELVSKPESISKISEVLDKIEAIYQQKGYLLARVSNIEITPDGVLNIEISEGIINTINITGNDKTKEKFIKKLMPNLLPGETYNEILLVQDLRNLQNTGFFEDVKRSVQPSKEDPSKYDLNIELKEKRTASFGFGGGVNTVSGAFGNVGFSNKNLFGEGKEASVNSQIGTGLLSSTLGDDRFLVNKRTHQFEARYTDPFFKDTNTKFSLFANSNAFNSYQVDLAQEKSIGAGTSFVKPLGMNLFGGLELFGENVELKQFGSGAENFLAMQLLTVDNGDYLGDLIEKNAAKPGQSLNAYNESVKKDTAQAVAKELRKEQLEGGNYLYFDPSIAYDTRDSEVNARRGWNNKLVVGQAVGIGNDSYSKLGIDIRKYVPVGQKATLAFNIKGNSSLFGDVPLFNQYKPGGYYGVRGYRPFSDLGIGTRSLLASVEYRTPFLDLIPGLKNSSISDNFRLVLFNDFGYVGGTSKINKLYNRLDTAASTGLGLRANLPFLGPVRIDYGIPLIKPLWKNNSSFGRFNFGFADRF